MNRLLSPLPVSSLLEHTFTLKLTASLNPWILYPLFLLFVDAHRHHHHNAGNDHHHNHNQNTIH